MTHGMHVRSPKMDFLKAIAIFLVVWGHSIQYLGSGAVDFFHDPAFILIYSFHMPLFMMLSGWVFFYRFESKSLKGIAAAKVRQLLIPVVSWSLLFAAAQGTAKGGPRGLLAAVYHFSIADVYDAFWFITILLITTMLFTLIVKTLPRYQGIALLMLWVVMLWLPDAYSMGFLKFMYPYFVLGYFANKFGRSLRRRRMWIGMASMLVFAFLVAGWQESYYIYVSGMSIRGAGALHQSFIVAYRYAAGLAGIGVMFFLASFLPDRMSDSRYFRLIGGTGRNTLGIYIISSFVFVNAINRIHIPGVLSFGRPFYDFVLTPIAALLMLVSCNYLIELLDRSDFARRYFLGRAPRGDSGSLAARAGQSGL